jgi:hypothetical protein
VKRRLLGCDWCGYAGRSRKARIDGRRVYLCERCMARLRRALDGDQDVAFMVRQLAAGGCR